MIFPRSGEPEHPDIATFIWQSAQFFSWADFVLPVRPSLPPDPFLSSLSSFPSL